MTTRTTTIRQRVMTTKRWKKKQRPSSRSLSQRRPTFFFSSTNHIGGNADLYWTLTKLLQIFVYTIIYHNAMCTFFFFFLIVEFFINKWVVISCERNWYTHRDYAPKHVASYLQKFESPLLEFARTRFIT